MRHTSRLQLYGYVGTPSPPPLTYALTSERAYNLARANGGLRNLVRLRGGDGSDTDLDKGNAMVPAWLLAAGTTINLASGWNGGTANNYRAGIANIFSSNRAGIGYERDSLDDPVAFVNAAWSLGVNQGWAWRVRVMETRQRVASGQDQPRAICGTRWGGWQFQIVDGSCEIMRLNGNWTQANEDTLNALLDIKEPTDEEQGQIDALRGPRKAEGGGVTFPNAIYDIHESLSLGKPVERDSGKFYELTFLPEPRGKLNVVLTGGEAKAVDVAEIVATRRTGTVTAAGAVSVYSSGAPFYWQVAELSFVTPASLRLGPYKNGYWTDSFDDVIKDVLADTSLPGVSASLDYEALNEVWFQFVLNLTCSNRKYCPFVYGAQATLPAGERDGSDTEHFDTTDLLANPTTEISMQCDGDSRRRSYTVTMRNVDGTTFDSDVYGLHYDMGENRVADLYIDGNMILAGGIVKASRGADMRAATPNQVPADVHQGESSLFLTICDGWQILDEDLMTDTLVGDGKRIGLWLREHLTNAGYSEAEIANVPADAGRLLPRASLGEGFCIQARAGEPRANHIRSVLDRWAMDWYLTHDNGVWRFAQKSTEVATYLGQPIHFKRSSVQPNASETYPGRFAVLAPLDHVRNFDESYNWFRVEGATIGGETLTDEWTVQEAIRRGAGPQSKAYIGRLKRYPVVTDEGIRTPDDLQYVLRSLVMRYGRLGRYYDFETYLHPFLQVGMRVLLDGIVCELTRIGNGSMDDRMQLTLQEVG